jgi:hypothetical protein
MREKPKSSHYFDGSQGFESEVLVKGGRIGRCEAGLTLDPTPEPRSTLGAME